MSLLLPSDVMRGAITCLCLASVFGLGYGDS